MRAMTRASSLLPALLLAACASTGGGDYLRIQTRSGRLYFVEKDGIRRNETTGYDHFTDEVTGKPVSLKAGSYTTRAASRRDIVHWKSQRLVYSGTDPRWDEPQR